MNNKESFKKDPINIDSNTINSKINDNNINENNFYNDNKLYCMNCGKKGHTFKKCIFPIISIGIICIKFEIKDLDFNHVINYSKKIQNNYLFSLDEISKLKKLKKKISSINFDEIHKSVKYLLIRRKNSLNYIEFMRGKYDLENIDYLESIFNLMSKHEKLDILNNNFDKLWNDLWNYDKKENKNEYRNSKEKFDLLKNGFYTKKNDISIYFNIELLIQNQVFDYSEPEWGFPKGRRNLKEKNINCANREFQEETNLKTEDYHILNMLPLEETYLSNNNSKYKHIYYISQFDSNKELKIDIENKNQNVEIGDIRWMSFEESLKNIRDYNIEKKTVLNNLDKSIKNTLRNFNEILDNFLEFL